MEGKENSRSLEQWIRKGHSVQHGNPFGLVPQTPLLTGDPDVHGCGCICWFFLA